MGSDQCFGYGGIGLGFDIVLKGVLALNTLILEYPSTVKVAFQNICRGSANANVFLE